MENSKKDYNRYTNWISLRKDKNILGGTVALKTSSTLPEPTRNGRLQQQYFRINKFKKTGYVNKKVTQTKQIMSIEIRKTNMDWIRSFTIRINKISENEKDILSSAQYDT